MLETRIRLGGWSKLRLSHICFRRLWHYGFLKANLNKQSRTFTSWHNADRMLSHIDKRPYLNSLKLWDIKLGHAEPLEVILYQRFPCHLRSQFVIFVMLSRHVLLKVYAAKKFPRPKWMPYQHLHRRCHVDHVLCAAGVADHVHRCQSLGEDLHGLGCSGDVCLSYATQIGKAFNTKWLRIYQNESQCCM